MLKNINALLMWRNNKFIGNTAILTIGTVIAQILQLIFYPVLSRLYTPSDFGVLATVISFTSVLGVIATGKFDSAILIAPSKQVAANLVALIIILSSIILTLSLIILLFFSESISLLFNDTELNYWILFSPILAFLSIIYVVYNEWCVRNEYFKQLSVNKITNGAAISLSKTSLGFVKMFSGGLVIGELLGRFITAILCTVHALKKDKAVLLQQSKKKIVAVAKRYADCPKFILPGQLLNTVNAQITTFFFLTFFSVTELGYYSMAQVVLILPALVITNSVKDIFRKRANDIFIKEGNCIVFYNKTLMILAGISFFGFSVFYFIAPALFELVLGDQWNIAGKYAQILSPIVAISFFTEVGASMFIIAEKMKESLLWQIGYLFLTVSSLLIGYYCFGDIISMLYCLMIGRSIAQSINFLMTRRFAMGK
jgi:O-antigen/teichoic acid export membrane protein